MSKTLEKSRSFVYCSWAGSVEPLIQLFRIKNSFHGTSSNYWYRCFFDKSFKNRALHLDLLKIQVPGYDSRLVSARNENVYIYFLNRIHLIIFLYGNTLKGLELHPKKTRLIRFGRFAINDCHKDGNRKSETFDFLGFTHYCTKSYKTGWFVVARKTIKKPIRARPSEIKTELRRRINRPIAETGEWLHRVLTGHLNYYAVPGNGKSISSFFYCVSWYWLRQLRRRSQRHRMTWERFSKFRDRFFPLIRIIHPQPLHRFDAKTQGRSPVR